MVNYYLFKCLIDKPVGHESMPVRLSNMHPLNLGDYEREKTQMFDGNNIKPWMPYWLTILLDICKRDHWCIIFLSKCYKEKISDQWGLKI